MAPNSTYKLRNRNATTPTKLKSTQSERNGKKVITLQGEKRVNLERGASLSTSSANLFILSSGSYTT